MTPEDLCQRFTGVHYRDSAFRRAADTMDWNNRWPLIDRDGYLTGAVTEGDDCLNVNNEVMILPWVAKAGCWSIDFEEGTATPTQPAIAEGE
jgi:hypothetical protein